ncbi:MAG: FimB/Mfa2 family fimbrial subunit [Muribaculaceae bacterium]|jgi:Protein of unknown function (DUF1812).|nr:FimB/Mfa2 family fimbrial subunit [Muribaculaceae bacterium]
MSKVLYNILIPVVVLLLCPACITEVDVGACNNTVIRFEYLADGQEDVFPEYISSVTYCIYDGEGGIVTQATLDKNMLDEFQGLKLRLHSAGDYSLVAWGNLGTHCELYSEEKLSDGKVAHPSETPGTFDRLYLGTLSFNLESVDGRHEWVAPLHSAHVTLNAYIQSTLSEAAGAYAIRVGKFATGVSNSGETLGPDREYCPVFTDDIEGRIKSTTWLPRFDENTEATIEVFSTISESNVASVKLSDYISANNIRITGVEEAVIDVLISVSGTNISIKFPGWKPKPVYPSI